MSAKSLEAPEYNDRLTIRIVKCILNQLTSIGRHTLSFRIIPYTANIGEQSNE